MTVTTPGTMMTARQRLLWRSIGRRVRHYRRAAGRNQAWLAAQVHLSRTSIANLELGRQRTVLDLLYDIARVLDVSLWKLVPRAWDVYKQNPRRDDS